MKLKHVTSFIAGGTPDTSNDLFWREEGIPWVAIGDMSAGGRISTTAKSLSPEGVADRRLTLGKPGTILFAMYASVGAVATLGIEATWNQALLGVTPTPGRADSKFIGYWLRHYAPHAIAEARSATQANLNAEQVANFPFPDYPVEEQRRIAEFLDDRVSRIDQIITARRRQLALGEEVFQSWWDARHLMLVRDGTVVPLRRVLRSIVDGPFGSSLTSQHYSDAGSRVVRLGNIGIAEFRDGDQAFIPDEYAATLTSHAVVAGDLVMAGLGDDRWPLGRCAVVPDIGPAIVKADCYRIRLVPEVSHEYAAIVLSGPAVTSRVSVLSRGATRARLNTEVAREAPLVVVPTDKQTSFIAEWRCHRQHLRHAHENLTASIKLLTEYKSSLISAAVTGEIDVTTAGSTIPG